MTPPFTSAGVGWSLSGLMTAKLNCRSVMGRLRLPSNRAETGCARWTCEWGCERPSRNERQRGGGGLGTKICLNVQKAHTLWGAGGDTGTGLPTSPGARVDTVQYSIHPPPVCACSLTPAPPRPLVPPVRWKIRALLPFLPTRGALKRDRKKKKGVPQHSFPKKTACSSYVQPWLVSVGGWRLVAIGGWQLAAGGWWWLAAVGGW